MALFPTHIYTGLLVHIVPRHFLLCGRLREDRLSSSKLPADSGSAETSLLYQTCKVAFMMTVHIHHDGRDPDAQTVHLADLQAQTCSFASTAMPRKEKGPRRSLLLPAVSVWVLESLHAGFFKLRTVKECWFKMMDDHLKERKED